MQSIGESLKNAREQKGISLEQAEDDTKIRKRYLQALEDGEYSIIPGSVYAKGFLRNYANYLGLN
ncbi:MAG TPA: helix-turn-helix domain-containing protein, partial [Desulfobacteria bacterium]|nr:helix-turn-helix domain-containing protein [Desulfobacteria bacterium]